MKERKGGTTTAAAATPLQVEAPPSSDEETDRASREHRENREGEELRKKLSKNVQEILIFAISLGAAYSIMFALYDTIDPAFDKASVGISLLYAVCVHSVCACFAVMVVMSTNIPHQVEETVLLPIGLLPGLMWNAAISDWLDVVEEVPGASRFESILLFVCSAISVQFLVSAFVVLTSACLFGSMLPSADTIKNRHGAKSEREKAGANVAVAVAKAQDEEEEQPPQQKTVDAASVLDAEMGFEEDEDEDEDEPEEEGVQLEAFEDLRGWPQDTPWEIVTKYSVLWLGCFVRILPMAMMETIALSWRKPLYLMLDMGIYTRWLVAVPLIFGIEFLSVHLSRHRAPHRNEANIYTRIADRFRFFIFTTGFFNIAYVLMAVPKAEGEGVTNLGEALGLDSVSIVITGLLCFGKAYAFTYFEGWAEHEHKGHDETPDCTPADLHEDFKETCHVLSEALDTMLGIALGLFFTDMVQKNKVKNLHLAVFIRWLVVAACLSVIAYLVHLAHLRIMAALQKHLRIMMFISRKMKAFRARIARKKFGRRRMQSIVGMHVESEKEVSETSSLLDSH